VTRRPLFCSSRARCRYLPGRIVALTRRRSPRVVIIGAGFGGLAAAVALRRRGIDDLTIIERADGVRPGTAATRTTARPQHHQVRTTESSKSATKRGVSVDGRQNKATKKQTSRKVGPKAAIVSLVDSGFFATPKTGPEVQTHLKTRRGFDLGTDQIRLAMLRLVRDGALERDENKEGQYEYKRP